MSDVFSERGSLHSIHIYPIKSLEGIQVDQAEVLPNGALKYDRQFAFFESEKDEWVRAKGFPQLIKLKTDYDLENMIVRIKYENEENTF
ncbi:MAG: MOSC N-terminal beta barrel domain-containing protein, partial [Planctomycetes bacterium]|nr:MOSC N-terminal beta barrel domain-containing protein [Planctomycetota bacterium]